MPTHSRKGRTFDARPDRIDYRDRIYQPPLVSLPEAYPHPKDIEEFLPAYYDANLVLDQGQEGACTGFGLGAVINYLHWSQAVLEAADYGEPPESVSIDGVSPQMLYHMARVYDEWAGEDYEGSSCRGAMKGWHRHGVCAETLWKQSKSNKYRPKRAWISDAAMRPLGAYYRINKDSIVDMQAAIYEVGAIYCSGDVHDGWFMGETQRLSTIPYRAKTSGGHAFALVGYNKDGFIVQNSWGGLWGYWGFAVLTYDDWVQRGADAWVATMGAPVKTRSTGRSVSTLSLQATANGRASWFWRGDHSERAKPYKNPKVEPLEEHRAYEQTLVLGNNGSPLNRLVDCPNAIEAAADVCYELPRKWLAQKASNKRIAIYAHGGLNDEDASVKRVRVMAPYFLENDIYPIFVTWRTGFLESLVGSMSDSLARFSGRKSEGIVGDIWEGVTNTLVEARDRTIEVACERVVVKGIWSQMKQNAEAGAMGNHGLSPLCGHLARLKTAHPKTELHLVGHSAGSILLGHLLKLMSGKKLKVRTCSLWAPACTIGFAVDHYGAAFKKNTLEQKNLHLDVLSDEAERADSVKVYGKSLLYLVSRALEQVHKMPILGMENAWMANDRDLDHWHDSAYGASGSLIKWHKVHGPDSSRVKIHKKGRQVDTGPEKIDLAHGSFDNDVETVTRMLARVRGSKVRTKVESLAGF
jgi:hypothetical protein